MEKTVNKGVSCGVCDCRFNRDGMSCMLDKIHVGNCSTEPCTCCDSFEKKN